MLKREKIIKPAGKWNFGEDLLFFVENIKLERDSIKSTIPHSFFHSIIQNFIFTRSPADPVSPDGDTAPTIYKLSDCAVRDNIDIGQNFCHQVSLCHQLYKDQILLFM